MRLAVLVALLSLPNHLNVKADESELPLGTWKPVEVWSDGRVQPPDRSYFTLFINERQQWALGDWPDYPDVSDARIADEAYRPSGVVAGPLSCHIIL